MTEEQRDLAQEKREKRKRVKRMKTFIVTFLSVWIMLSILLTTVLCIKVYSLQKQIDKLAESVENAAATATAVSDTDQGSVRVEPVTEAIAKENLAEEGDVHKVYLTFDDGPSDNTDAILEILNEYNVKATFFVVGKEDQESRDRMKRIVDEGHTIGMHSYAHKYSEIYSSLENFSTDVEKMQNLIEDATGVRCMIYRFPGSSSNMISNTDMTDYIRYLNEQGIAYYDWNVSSGDSTSQVYTADELVENVMNDVVKYKTSVVLLHDSEGKETTVEALSSLIERLQEINAEILPITDDTVRIQYMTVSANN
ncbi:MAG: polysaccharide deacetylase [Lachnospiraceae bacterium]|nr:polysaccharide deacetylase [Lachnospiraceae bacterium]